MYRVAFLYILSFLLTWQFVGYPLLMGILAIKTKPKNRDCSFQPFVSIVVPTYNEERVVEERIKNILNLAYPKDKQEILVVDSGSTDKTAEIVQRFIERNTNSEPVIKLVREKERRGKASAINEGKKQAKGDIVLVTDANSIFEMNVLKKMMPHFEDPIVGAVGGRYCVANPSNPLTDSTQFYWDLEYIMRRGEAALDSACLFHGEINAWRKDIVDADPRMLSEDLDMAIKIRKKGYKIEYEPNAIVYEPAATTSKEQIIQRKRTSIGTIQSMFKHWKYFLLPSNWYSLLIFPSHKCLVMFSPFIILTIPILYVFVRDLHAIIIHLILTSFVFIISFLALMYVKSILLKNRNIDRTYLFSPLQLAYYIVLNEYLIIMAWKDFLVRNYSVLWTKVESTR